MQQISKKSSNVLFFKQQYTYAPLVRIQSSTALGRRFEFGLLPSGWIVERIPFVLFIYIFTLSFCLK